MKKHGGTLKRIDFSKTALRDLDGIARYSEEKFSANQAKAYISLLQNRIKQIASEPMLGREFELRPELRYLTVHFKAGTYGHVVVYRDLSENIEILHIFHTAQDWRRDLETD